VHEVGSEVQGDLLENRDQPQLGQRVKEKGEEVEVEEEEAEGSQGRKGFELLNQL
jgi:hypothetical protein